jgi:hypothetical protein
MQIHRSPVQTCMGPCFDFFFFLRFQRLPGMEIWNGNGIITSFSLPFLMHVKKQKQPINANIDW